MGRRHQIKSVLSICCILAALLPAAVSEKIISEDDTWRFHNGFTLPAVDWYTTNYNDNVSGWFSFPSGFGYGDGDDATVLNDMTNNYAAFFTRKTFVVSNPAAINYLTLGADYDDGFVAWINGIEVARRNVTSNTINQATFAAGNHEASRGNGGSNPQEKEFITVTNNLATLLVTGTNLIAVSGHNVSLTSSDASLIIELYTNITLVRGPFIQMPNSNDVAVVWRTDALTDSTVDYSLDLSYGSTVSDPTLTREHVVNIPGLSFGTNYNYRIRSGGVTLWQGDALHTKRAGNQPFRFLIIGDFGQGTPEMTRVANAVNAVSDADLLLTVGDNIYFDGQPGSFDPWWFSIYAPTMRRAPCMPALGNHDVADGEYSGFAYLNNFYLPTNGPAGQIERNYSFDYGNAHFVTFDSNPTTNPAINTATITAIKTWLSNDLASTSKPWKFVYFHHPPYTSTGGHDDDEGVKTNYMPIIEAAGVQVVFNGHQHWYERMNAIKGVYHVTSGDSGAALSSVSSREPYSAVLLTNFSGFTQVDIDSTKLKLTHFNTNGVVADTFNLDIGHPFKIDGLLDAGASNAWLRAQNGLRLYAAIRKNFLYVATQDAGEGSDHFIYLNNVLSTNRPANWSKAGTVMQWSAFLADENDGAFVSWFGNNEQMLTNFPAYQSMTSGLNNNGAVNNGVLEGTIDLSAHFGSWPQQVYLAAAPFATANGGALVPSVLVSNVNGNANIESNEFVRLNTRDIALDLPVANAGGTTSVLVNTSITLSGTGSAAPSGGTLSYAWTKLSGPNGTFVGTTTASPTYTPGAFTGSSSNALFALVVNDGRFDSDTNTALVVVKNDSDGDGLTDDEETTGVDNFLTVANPNGNTSDPLVADTDGDGASDGQEAIAGTIPTDSNSLFHIIRITPEAGGGFVVEWASVSNKTYRVQYRDDWANGWSDLPGDVLATTARTNVTDATASGQSNRFYRVIIP